MQLVITEVSRIQSYVYSSNRMRENVGASHLVVKATEDWALETINQIAPRNNLSKNTLEAFSQDDQCIESGILDAEVLYSGGGNFAVLFRNEGTCLEFVRMLSRKILTDAPGLQLVIVKENFEWSESLFDKVQTGLKNLAKKKRAWVPSSPLLGLGVTAACSSTALPAVGMTPTIGDEPGYPASAEVLAKVQMENIRQARKRLYGLFPVPQEYAYPTELDHLGQTARGYKHIAVVHIDGNDMGQRKETLCKSLKNPGQNRAYIQTLRNFSEGVKAAAEQALTDVITKLIQRLQSNGGSSIVHNARDGKGKIIREIARIELKELEKGQWHLPILPLVYGGDDVTFICEGRLGLSLAKEYILAFEKETAKRPELQGKITVCAGIAVVKSHYPFAQAYRLAEDLCSTAKSYRRSKELEDSCLDWHFALSGFSGGIDEIRRREYGIEEFVERNRSSKTSWLTLRPVTIGKNLEESFRALPVVERGIIAFQGPDWVGRRNKLKALREALRAGSQVVEQFTLRFDQLPIVEPSMNDWPRKGWQGRFCGYFDALELMDWYIPLEVGEK